MITAMLEIIKKLPEIVVHWIEPNIRLFLSSRQPKIWLVALFIGLCVSAAVIAFRELVGLIQWPWLGDITENVATAARNSPWYIVLFGPAIGGLLVGWMLHAWLPSKRTSGIADVIEARAMGGRTVLFWPGVKSAVVSAVSLGFGASAGREGPIVHLGASISSSLSHALRFPDWGRRTLLACGAAAAVSASFNTPIAGVLFAHEVILCHYAMRSFVPIVITSVSGTLLSRLWFGDAAAFAIPDYQITSYLEFPAFFLLGIVCAVVAVAFQFALIATDYVARNIEMPPWLRPAVGGLLIGLIGLLFPEIFGVGYEATDMALKNQIPLYLLLLLIFAKTAATAITLASRFGGGIIAPSLFIGAMTGGAFGLIAARAFPELASSDGLYSILGMGAVAAAVMGAPISTAVMVFELTGGYALSVALLLVVSIATGLNQAIHGRSYFEWQLETRGLLVHDGPHNNVVKNTKVYELMSAEDDAETKRDPDEHPQFLYANDTLEHALQTFDQSGRSRLPVVSSGDDLYIIGWAQQVAALRYFNKALIDVSVEEHR